MRSKREASCFVIPTASTASTLVGEKSVRARDDFSARGLRPAGAFSFAAVNSPSFRSARSRISFAYRSASSAP
jgi:hypothetical protein